MNDHDHLAMMKNRGDWPRWPLLPLKRRVEGENMPEVGVLYATAPYTFYRTNLFEVREAIDRGLKGEETTPEELIAQGWIVD